AERGLRGVEVALSVERGNVGVDRLGHDVSPGRSGWSYTRICIACLGGCGAFVCALGCFYDPGNELFSIFPMPRAFPALGSIYGFGSTNLSATRAADHAAFSRTQACAARRRSCPQKAIDLLQFVPPRVLQRRVHMGCEVLVVLVAAAEDVHHVDQLV